MSAGPYAGRGWCEDRPSRAEARADQALAPGQAEALLRAERARVAQLDPDARARYERSTADPWALCPSCRQYVERLPAETCPTPEAHTWPTTPREDTTP